MVSFISRYLLITDVTHCRHDYFLSIFDEFSVGISAAIEPNYTVKCYKKTISAFEENLSALEENVSAWKTIPPFKKTFPLEQKKSA